MNTDILNKRTARALRAVSQEYLDGDLAERLENLIVDIHHLARILELPRASIFESAHNRFWDELNGPPIEDGLDNPAGNS